MDKPIDKEFLDEVKSLAIKHKMTMNSKEDIEKLKMMRQIENQSKEKKLLLQNDMISYAILCMYEPNVEKFKISEQTQAKIIQNAFMTFFAQFALTACLYWEFSEDTTGYYKLKNRTFKIYMAKFITAFAMHLLIFHEFAPAMRIMKYTIYHQQQMTQPQMAIFLAIVQMFSCFLFEVINVQILFSRSNVYFTISSYITVDLLRGFGKYYFNAIERDSANLLAKVMTKENALVVSVRGKHFKNNSKPLSIKFMMFWYKLIKIFYASLFFYFVPFLYVIMQGMNEGWFIGTD